jgi:hypothetical protein
MKLGRPTYTDPLAKRRVYLARYGLIVREDNDGSVGDRSRYVYGKEPHVRAHRKNIVKYADKPALAKKHPHQTQSTRESCQREDCHT